VQQAVPNTPPTLDCGRNVHMKMTQAHALNPIASESVGEREAVTSDNITTCDRSAEMPMWCSQTPAAHTDHSTTDLNNATAQPR